MPENNFESSRKVSPEAFANAVVLEAEELNLYEELKTIKALERLSEIEEPLDNLSLRLRLKDIENLKGRLL